MERKAITEFYKWKERRGRKPLVVYGARQVGKTWLIREFARRAYPKSVYVNFEDNDRLATLFEKDFDIERILKTISIVVGQDVDGSTLLIFDEVQAVHRGVTSLKYFCEKAPWLHVIAAGSLLGIAQHRNDSFPVGKVDSVYIHPMDFEEFLIATGRTRLAETLRRHEWEVITAARDKFQQALREYYYIGGMPGVVQNFIDNHDFMEARRLQLTILDDYERDFSKHAPNSEVPRIRMVWHSVCSQLSKENRKFIYGMLKTGARAREFELAIEWLSDAGLVFKVPRIKAAELPLTAFEDFSAFKLFMLDTGLLCAMSRISAETLMQGNELFLTAKGALTEQYVAQQLRTIENTYAGYWSASNSQGEIDFLVQHNDKIIPIEVKAEENLKAKSLRSFVERNRALHGLRLSMSDYRQQDWMTNFPLYSLPFIFNE